MKDKHIYLLVKTIKSIGCEFKNIIAAYDSMEAVVKAKEKEEQRLEMLAYQLKIMDAEVYVHFERVRLQGLHDLD